MKSAVKNRYYRVLTWVGRNRFGSILAKFREFLQFLAILVQKRTIWSIFFLVFEISGKFPTNWSVHFLMDLPIWVNFGLIWGIFTVFYNSVQKTDHLVIFFLRFWNQRKISYDLVRSVFDEIWNRKSRFFPWRPLAEAAAFDFSSSTGW